MTALNKYQTKWLQALRFGEYEQGRNGHLREHVTGGPDKWCCLGVAADAAFDAEWNHPFDPEPVGVHPPNGLTSLLAESWDANYLPYRWAEKLGLLAAGDDPNTDDQLTLASANDSGEHSFDSIADALEMYFKSSDSSSQNLHRCLDIYRDAAG